MCLYYCRGVLSSRTPKQQNDLYRSDTVEIAQFGADEELVPLADRELRDRACWIVCVDDENGFSTMGDSDARSPIALA